MKRVILWFRQDLRLHDNEALQEALGVADEIVPVYIFDTRIFESETLFGFPKTGPIRRKFVAEAVNDLRKSLRSLDSELIIRRGITEDILFDLAAELKTNWIFCNRERTPEEVVIQDNLEKRLWTIGQEVRFSRGKMLYYTSDLPYPVTHTPDSFAAFRKETERIVEVRDPLPTPLGIPWFTETLEPGEVPERYLDSGNVRGHVNVIGGESAALHRLRHLIGALKQEGDISSYNEEPSFSPFLAQGCISPKRVYHGLNNAVAKGNPKGIECILDGLLRRDHCRLIVKKYGSKVFERGSVANARFSDPETLNSHFADWVEGTTGVPIVDAAMRKLRNTGYIANDLRVICARYLLNELGLSWRTGASYFESVLIDYDPCSNWVNWANIAGVGPDVRDDRPINYDAQQSRFDPDGEFVNRWLSAGAAS